MWTDQYLFIHLLNKPNPVWKKKKHFDPQQVAIPSHWSNLSWCDSHDLKPHEIRERFDCSIIVENRDDSVVSFFNYHESPHLYLSFASLSQKCISGVGIKADED